MSEEMQTAVVEKPEQQDNLAAIMKKQVKWTKVCAIVCIVMLVVLIACVVWLLPQVSKALDSFNTVADKLNSIDWDALVENINKLTSTGQGSMTDISDAIGKLDVDGLNKAISDLQTAISPLVKLFS